jgi:hypothetical protein
MRVEEAPRNYTILTSLPVTSTEIITPIVDNKKSKMTVPFPLLGNDCWVNGFILSLYTYVEIESLDDITLPEYLDTDTRTERLTKTVNMEWGSDRFHLVLWETTMTNPDPTNFNHWTKVGALSLLNQSGFPYLRHRPFDLLTDDLVHALGENYQLGVSVQDVGYGRPTVDDLIVVRGAWKQEAIAPQPDQTPIIVQGTVVNVTAFDKERIVLVSPTVKQVLEPRITRTEGFLKNTSPTNTVYYSYTSTVSSTVNNGALAPNAQVPLPANLNTGIWAMSNAGTFNIITNEVYTG